MQKNSYLILLAILLFSLILRIPALFISHIENDEVIYQALAEQVSKNPLNYSVRGMPILKDLPKMNYDQPLFHRPPLFVYALAVFRNLLGEGWGILLPILSGALTIIVTFFLAKELYDERIALISSLILAFCPLLLFASMRILIDSQLVLLVSSTVWVFLLAVKKRKKILFTVSGVVLGLSILTKEPAIFISLPLFYLLVKDGLTKEKIVNLACFLGPIILTVAPWFFCFYTVYKTFFPWWAKIYPENIEMFPFIKMVVARPWYFYFQNITITAPIYIFAWIAIIINFKKRQMITETLWAFSFLIPITIYGIMGQGYQTRYILPAMPALAILSANLISNKNKFIWPVTFVLLGLGFLTGILNSYIFHPADIFGLNYFFSLLNNR